MKEQLKGFGLVEGAQIDWAKFTLQNRILDSGIPYNKIAEPWQKEIDNAISTHQRVYLQLARGHDKTDRYAWWSLLWLATTHAARGYAAGVDRDNAALFRDASRKLKALHPDLFYAVEVQKNIVMNKETGSYIETISSDADSAYGLNFDLLIVNDYHAWKDTGFWNVLWTACGKKPGIRIWMESNALTLGGEGVQEIAKFRKWVKEQGTTLTGIDGNPEWFFYSPTRFLASWQSRQLSQWQATMHPSAYRRLIDNVDTSGEESFVTPEQVEAITTLKGPYTEKIREGRVVTSSDLGIKKDSTSIATCISYPVERGQQPRIHLLALDVLSGNIDSPVQYREINALINQHRERFNPRVIQFDPWNAQVFIQTIPRAVEWNFTAARVSELSKILYQAIINKNLAIYPNAAPALQGDEQWDLQREMCEAVMKDMSYGQRIDHRAQGYTDRIMSVGMCVHYLMSEAGLPHTKQIVVKAEKPDDFDPNKIAGEWESDFKNSKNTMGLIKI